MSKSNAVSRHEIIEVPLFGSRFMVCRGTEKQNRDYLLRELEYEQEAPLLPSTSGARLMTLHDNKTEVPLWVLLFPRRVCPSLMVHELYHLVQAVAEYHGIEDGETEAYLMEWFYTSIVVPESM